MGTFFVLWVGDKTDSVSVDRLKPVISAVPVTPAVPLSHGRPCLVSASTRRPPAPVPPPVKKVRFSVPVPATKLCLNPHRTV